jgi:hypothetical protein
MLEKAVEIYGEFGEILEPFISTVKGEDEELHATVAINLDGFTIEKEGYIFIALSPSEAKNLSNRLLEMCEKANEANYNLLRHKDPFKKH